MKRYIRAIPQLQHVDIAYALKRSLKTYGRKDLRADIFAGLVVCLVAIPLSMALGIASGVAPQNALYTAIIAGFIVALLGGSKVQVTGPTAAFVALLAPISAKYGIEGLLLSGLMAGVMLVAMAYAGMGRLVSIIPYPVTTGFTLGIGIVIATLQIKDLCGLQLPHEPETFFQRLILYWNQIETIQVSELAVGLTTLAALFVWPRVNKTIPAPVVVLTFAGVVVFLLNNAFHLTSISTIHSRFSYLSSEGLSLTGIPTSLPIFNWSFFGDPETFFFHISELLPSSFAIALLGAIESLLSAVVADTLTGKKHNPDSELFALGIGNIICPFFGGIAATGAIARTSTNIRFGARSPIAAATHGLSILVILVFFAPIISYLPMASMAALMVFIAYNMADLKHVNHIVKVAPRSDVFVLLAGAGFTVFYDMVVGIGVGMALATFLFMQRMAQLTEGRILSTSGDSGDSGPALTGKKLVYEIRGPMFFGAAERAMSSLATVGTDIEEVVFDFTYVPSMDLTGLVALETIVGRLRNQKVVVKFSSLSPEVRWVLSRSDKISELVV